MLASDLSTAKKHVVKIIRKTLENGEENAAGLAKARAEIEQLRKCKGYANIVQLEDVIEDEEQIAVVMEYCEGGNLMVQDEKDPESLRPADCFTAADLTREGTFSEEKVRLIIQQVSDGIKFLHDNGIVHGEITPHNILIDGEGRVRITGLGQEGAYKSKLAKQLAPKFLKMVSTKLAEEDGEEATRNGDMYQLGALISSMLFGNMHALRQKKLEEDGETEPSVYSASGVLSIEEEKPSEIESTPTRGEVEAASPRVVEGEQSKGLGTLGESTVEEPRKEQPVLDVLDGSSEEVIPVPLEIQKVASVPVVQAAPMKGYGNKTPTYHESKTTVIDTAVAP